MPKCETDIRASLVHSVNKTVHRYVEGVGDADHAFATPLLCTCGTACMSELVARWQYVRRHLQEMQHHVERPNNIRPDLHGQKQIGGGRCHHGEDGNLFQLRSDLLGYHDCLHGQSLRERQHLTLAIRCDKKNSPQVLGEPIMLVCSDDKVFLSRETKGKQLGGTRLPDFNALVSNLQRNNPICG